MSSPKIAIITGAGTGIGKATAQALLGAGYRVTLAGRRAEPLHAVVAELAAKPDEALVVPTDVADPASVKAMFAATVQKWGRVDVLFNNAGVGAPGVPLEELTIEQWKQVVDINLNGTMRCCTAARPLLAPSRGCIINTASMLSFFGGGLAPAYSASKHGVIGLTQTAALEYAGQGIRINAICPGYMDTPMTHGATTPDVRRALAAATPAGRLGQPGEVAELAVWLCSSAATFVHGAFIPVDGGVVAG